MATVTFQSERIQLHPGETVLDGFIRQGVNHPFSCRSGICQTCLLRRVDGPVPEEAREGLSEALIASDHLLPCTCVPESDLWVAPPLQALDTIPAKVVEKTLLGDGVLQLLLAPAEALPYEAGQYLSLRFPGSQEFRSYSLASVPALDRYLELQVKLLAGGKFSSWIHHELAVGKQVELLPPQGTCHYQAVDGEQPLILIGTGIGLTPMIGILRDALYHRQHQGPIYLYHGSRAVENLYLIQELMALAATHEQLHYYPCVSGLPRPPICWGERATDLALIHHPSLANYQLYACGRRAVVETTQQQALAAGLLQTNFFADIIDVVAPLGNSAPPEPSAAEDETYRFPAPDLALWTALEEGDKLRRILQDFYQGVYQDPRLAPFFEHSTMERAIQKQYSFLYQAFTGKQVYLGESPRNAHHWMVISDELFDYRERLFEAAIRREGGLPEAMIQRWLALQEATRPMLVKQKPWPKLVEGKALSLGSVERMEAPIAMLCDRCQAEIEAGERVAYHTRLGETYCQACA